AAARSRLSVSERACQRAHVRLVLAAGIRASPDLLRLLRRTRRRPVPRRERAAEPRARFCTRGARLPRVSRRPPADRLDRARSCLARARARPPVTGAALATEARAET